MEQLNKEKLEEREKSTLATSPRILHMSLEGGLNDNDLLAIGKAIDDSEISCNVIVVFTVRNHFQN